MKEVKEEMVLLEMVINVLDMKKVYLFGIPHGNSCTHGDISSMAFPDDCCGCSKNDLIYIVDGDEVGIGADGEPLLRNIKIIEQLPFNYFSFIEV